MVALSRFQKRLLWVLDTYGENDPLTAIYTCVAVELGLGPSAHNISLMRMIYVFGSRLEHGFTGKTHSWEQLPASGIPLGKSIEMVVENLCEDVRTTSIFHHDSACAKIVPAIARWVQHALDVTDARDELDLYWDTPARDVPKIDKMPDPVFLGMVRDIGDGFRFICDWYLGARPNLGDYSTWEEARAAATEWHQTKQIETTMRAPPSTVVYRWPDGWSVVCLDNWPAFKFEGGALGHCLGDHGIGYWDEYLAGRSRFFSLRDPVNRPWLTIQVEAPYVGAYQRGDGRVEQIKGCKNRLPGMGAGSRDCPDPHPTECARVFDFISAAGDEWVLDDDYQSCWAYTAAALGLPRKVQARPVAGFVVGRLIRPPTPVAFEPGKPTKAFDPHFWGEPAR